MPVFFQSRAGRQCLVLVGLGFGLFVIGIFSHISEWLADRMAAPEPNATDEILLAFCICGGISFAYSVLRILDLRKEMNLIVAARARADWIATHDHLTKLPNRYAFERWRMPAARNSEDEQDSSTVTVFSLDLDGFKKVNDLTGHKGGDALLVEIAKRISAFGKADSVYRFGGDEFVLVAAGLSPQREEALAKMLIQAVTRPIQIAGISVEVGASIGYDRWDGREALADVAHRSDLAMYEAKALGHNSCLAFEPGMQNKVAQRAFLETKLRGAIEQKAIRPFYQPLIDMSNGALCGFEALARWIDESGTPVAPPVFIAIAEETGMITALFESLLLQACTDARDWPSHIGLSFNLSPVQMEDRLLASRIFKILQQSGLDPRRLEIEITENALIQDPQSAATILEVLHESGVQIALDDFGTGYSSLEQLARFRFDKIKIDKSFVSTFLTDSRQEKIVRAMLGLGRSLNVKTTAEGVETKAQLAFLKAEGCDIGQGYLFGAAMPQDQAIAYIANHSATGARLRQSRKLTAN